MELEEINYLYLYLYLFIYGPKDNNTVVNRVEFNLMAGVHSHTTGSCRRIAVAMSVRTLQ